MDFFYYTDQNFSLYRARYKKEYNLRACETLESDAPQVPSEHYIVLTEWDRPVPHSHAPSSAPRHVQTSPPLSRQSCIQTSMRQVFGL